MPIDATPPGQFVVALATKCTGDWTVDPSFGPVTETPANADVANNANTQIVKSRFMG
jgi:hypothetical protein